MGRAGYASKRPAGADDAKKPSVPALHPARHPARSGMSTRRGGVPVPTGRLPATHHQTVAVLRERTEVMAAPLDPQSSRTSAGVTPGGASRTPAQLAAGVFGVVFL